MITLVEALRFRSLRYLQRTLGPMQILVGPNASGKTTFLDVFAFLGTVVSDGVKSAFEERTRNPLDLCWDRVPATIELALEASIPEHLRKHLRDQHFDTIRYEIGIEVDAASLEVSIASEKGLLKVQEKPDAQQRIAFPEPNEGPRSILTGRQSGTAVFSKVPGGNDNFYSEVYPKAAKGWVPSYRLGPRKSALANLPDDESSFPVSTWFRDLLAKGLQQIVLNSRLLRQASAPGFVRGYRPDGSNLPWVIQGLKQNHPALFADWIAHLRTALPDLETSAPWYETTTGTPIS